MKKIQQFMGNFFVIDITKINTRGIILESKYYIEYRILMAFLISVDFAYLIFYGSSPKNYIYLTYWGFTLALLYFLIVLLELLIFKIFLFKRQIKIWKIIHTLFVVVINMEIMINCIYWFAFFPYLLKSYSAVNSLDIIQALCAHMVPLLLLFVQMMVNTVLIQNYKMLTCVILVLILYLILNAVYSIVVTPIYSLLNYKDVLSYIFIAAAIIIILISYYVLKKYSQRFKKQIILFLLRQDSNTNNNINQIDLM